MKKKSLVLFIMALFLTTFSFAQGFHIGAKGGVNIFKVDGKSFKEEFDFGYNVGGFVEIPLGQKWGIQPEVMWNQTNFRTGENFSSIYPGGVDDVEGKLDYLSIPLLLYYNPAKFISFQAGPQFGILINEHKSVFENRTEAFKTGDFSMLGGVQLNIGALKVGGRYVVGLANINDIDDKEKWKNQGFQVYIGTRIL